MNPLSKSQNFKEVLFYDASMKDIEMLTQGMDPNVVTVPLFVGDPVLEKLQATMQNPQLRCIHILCHGAPGEVNIGGKRVDEYAWRSAFEQATPRNHTNPIQINFWSCKTGEGETGMNFINTVAQTSNAFVNAASGFVGHNELGGSWDLDVSAKPVAPFSVKAREGFRQVLAIEPEPTFPTVVRLISD